MKRNFPMTFKLVDRAEGPSNRAGLYVSLVCKHLGVSEAFMTLDYIKGLDRALTRIIEQDGHRIEWFEPRFKFPMEIGGIELDKLHSAVRILSAGQSSKEFTVFADEQSMHGEEIPAPDYVRWS